MSPQTEVEVIDEEIKYESEDLAIALGADQQPRPVKLSISNKRISWEYTEENGEVSQRFHSHNFKSVILHAVQNDPCCLYCQIEPEAIVEEDCGPNIEIRIFPTQLLNPMPVVTSIYRTMCECASLNPDSDHDEDDERFEGFCSLNGDDDDGEEEEEGEEQAEVEYLQTSDKKFEDAEKEEEEKEEEEMKEEQ